MSRKPKLSKRRLEVLASYGKLPVKPVVKKDIAKNSDNDLPKHSPVRWQKEISQEHHRREQKTIRAVLANKTDTRTDLKKQQDKLMLKNRASRQVNRIYLDGLLSACASKKGTKHAPSAFDDTSAIFYNMQDNFIEEQYHGKTSAFDPRHNDLIEIDPNNGKMIWHGETCAICTMPPSNMGEVVLAQYGEANFVCTDCGKLVKTKGLGMRGWIFTQIQNIKRHKATQVKKYHLPNSEDDEELA